MILARLCKAMTRIRARLLPGGTMAKALDYALERKTGLTRFVADGRIEIDSNLVNAARAINEIIIVLVCRGKSVDS